MSGGDRQGATPTYDEMESLFVNNDKLEQIRGLLNRFNPIRTMKMERMEIRHSAILSWLLDPAETHGLSDRFLKAFLGEALRGYNRQHPTALEVSQSDLRDAEIRREWQNIDIFILCPLKGWAFIIENKFDSRQREGQLAGYVEKVQSSIKLDDNPPLVRGIFLTLQDEEPQDAGYAPIKYGAIIEILARLMGKSSQPPHPEVKTFLKHYLEILEDATGMSDERTELEQLARDLYRDHKRVLDFVIEHGASSDFATAARTVFGENPDEFAVVDIKGRNYVFSGMNNKIVSFLPSDWYQACIQFSVSWPGCEGWWASFPVIAWVQIWGSDKVPEGQLTLYAEVGPLSDYPLRKALIEGIQRTAADKGLDRITFQSGAAEEGRRYSKFFKKNSVKVDDIHDADGMAKRMKELIGKFQPEFDAVAEVLPMVLKEADLAR